MFNKSKNLVLMLLALLFLVANTAISKELITNPDLKYWIKFNTAQLPGVDINEDGGITDTRANTEALAKIEDFICINSKLNSIDELIRYMPNLKRLACRNNQLTNLDISKNIKLTALNCCIHTEGFTLYLTNPQRNRFTIEAYCNAILKEKL